MEDKIHRSLLYCNGRSRVLSRVVVRNCFDGVIPKVRDPRWVRGHAPPENLEILDCPRSNLYST